MNHSTKENLTQVLLHIPQIESHLTETHMMILDYLKTQRFPRLAKTISAYLQLDYSSTRARLSELKSMGYIIQPNKSILHISDLNESGIVKFNRDAKKCGYSIIKHGA